LDIERVEAELAKKRMLAGRKLDPVQQIAQGKARDKAAEAVGVNRQYVSDAKKISKVDSGVADMVRAGTINLHEGKKLIALPEEARPTAVKALASGADIRAAVRTAKKLDYNERIQTAKPKAFEGTYRIILADPPWLYRIMQVNGAENHYGAEYGAENHYDCLNIKQLCDYRPGDGKRTVKELADKDAVLFMWVTAPMLERCFPIIEAWGFKYKTFFVWDKVKHNVGYYNSVRAELLLICTRGSCTPDTGKLTDSVQTIERSDMHSEKPQEFYDIIDAMYDHGRKLELFSRKARLGWDSDGNEPHASNQRAAEAA
jgi:N6-adenosine-specific RNA methylase IME4